MKHCRFTLAAFLLLATAQAADDIVIKLDLPKPVFLGTPRPIKVDNLDPSGKSQGELTVPAGTHLISRDKPVTGSDMYPLIGDLDLVTDGEKSGLDGANVEFGPGLQWVQIDLEAPANLAAIVVWHFHSQARVYHDVVVQASNDPEFHDGVQTLYNNDIDDSAGLGPGTDYAYIETNFGRIIGAKGTTARYVRLYSNGNTTDDLNHYCEVEVFGDYPKG